MTSEDKNDRREVNSLSLKLYTYYIHGPSIGCFRIVLNNSLGKLHSAGYGILNKKLKQVFCYF